MDQFNRQETGRLFALLSKNLETFIREVKTKQLTLLATDQWSVKDVLCHLVFWHESYAANYRALADNKEPPLLEGPGYMLNPQGVRSLRKYSRNALIERLRDAQESLYESIMEKQVPQMTYKKDGRVYRTDEFLSVIARHVVTHTKQVRRARKSKPTKKAP